MPDDSACDSERSIKPVKGLGAAKFGLGGSCQHQHQVPLGIGVYLNAILPTGSHADEWLISDWILLGLFHLLPMLPVFPLLHGDLFGDRVWLTVDLYGTC